MAQHHRPRGPGGARGDAVVRGLRMEPDLARALLAYAEKYAEEHELPERNTSAAARHLLREGLTHGGYMHCHGSASCHQEGYFAGIAEARAKLGNALREPS